MTSGTFSRTLRALPPQPSSFIGRSAEIALATELLGRSRLVTVTGTGGVGKTRLAIHVASVVFGRFRDGVHMAELAEVRVPELLVHTIAARLGIPDSDPRTQFDAVIDYLRERELLLVLDTCEHLVDACAELADTILREAPGVTILATSRQPLDMDGEVTLPLRPLPVPAARDSGDAQLSDAVRLFAERAAAANPGFAVTKGNLADVIALCQRLDGVPLAIELAAVRLRALSLHQMAERIDDRLRILNGLTGGRRAGAPRHHTLRAAIEWSYDLCTQAEQTLWARLSVFAGSFDIATAEAVCTGGVLAPDDVMETLASLADKSVLVRNHGDPDGAGRRGGFGEAIPDGATYRMLDTLREYGEERLHAAGGKDEAAVRSRFIAHYLGLTERFEHNPTADQLSQYQMLRKEHANLRAAFDFALDTPGNDGAAVVIATSLFNYWRISGLLREGEYWLDCALERCPERSLVRARVLSVRAYLRVLLGDFANGMDDAETAITMATAFGDMVVCGRAQLARHRALGFSGHLPEAEEAATAATAAFTAIDDAAGLAQIDMIDALLRLQNREPQRCYTSATQGLRRLPGEEIWLSAYLMALQGLGLFLCGDIDRAAPVVRRALAMKDQLGDVEGVAFTFGTLAFIAAAQQRYERTAWLLGASAPLWEQVGRWYTGSPVFEALHQAAERFARDGLGDRYWDVHGDGAAAPVDRVIEFALADADALPARLSVSNRLQVTSE